MMAALPSPSIWEIVSQAKIYLPTLNEDRISRAYDFAERAHSGQKRFSGEPYIIHPLNVAHLLLDFHPDEDTLVAALLHDVVEDTPHTLDEIEILFGKEVRNLCWGMEKLNKVRSKLNDQHVENLRKLFLAMAKDFRVVLLKLCDRLHNMKTLSFVRPDKQRRIAEETLNIYSPIAARLGIYRLKGDLEDLCFYYLEPAKYKNIQDQLVKTEKWRAQYIESAQKTLATILAAEGMRAKIDGRVKSIYSIYRKLRKKNKNFVQDIFDVFAMRIILPDIYKHEKEYTGHLYTALGIIHNHFTPLANRFKDYVAVPKVNSYRSLHTTVMGLGSKLYTQPTEIQIKTEGMHHAAEFGIAAHWIYEGMAKADFAVPFEEDEDTVSPSSPFLKQHQEWISGLHQIEQKISNNKEFLENLQIDMFQDRIFVLTPRGDVKDLPASATPIDFAYSVHTEIGNRCVGAKVNGNMVPLDHELKNGEVVEIITRKNARPSQQWLSFAKTNHARDRIRTWFRNLDVKKHLLEGKSLLNAKLAQLGKPLLDDRLSLLKTYGGGNLSMQEREDLLIEIGKGGIFPGAVVKNLFTREELLMSREEARIDRPARTIKQQKISKEPLLEIGNQENVAYQFVKCCNPEFVDGLVGYVTRGRGVSVHKEICSVLKNMEKTRLIPVRVLKENVLRTDGRTSGTTYSVSVRVEANDRVGLIRDISNAIAKNTINILKIDQGPSQKSIVTVFFLLEIGTVDQLERVLSDLEKVASVRRAMKVS